MTWQEFNISINCKHLYSFLPSRRLYQQLVHYPQVTFLGATTYTYVDTCATVARLVCSRPSPYDRGLCTSSESYF